MAGVRRCESLECPAEAVRLLDTINGPIALCEGHYILLHPDNFNPTLLNN